MPHSITSPLLALEKKTPCETWFKPLERITGDVLSFVLHGTLMTKRYGDLFAGRVRLRFNKISKET